jgi:hypothetical protein
MLRVVDPTEDSWIGESVRVVLAWPVGDWKYPSVLGIDDGPWLRGDGVRHFLWWRDRVGLDLSVIEP